MTNVGAGIGMVIAAILVLAPTPAGSHDHWISQGGHRNTAGEWCCGKGDCFVVPPEKVSVRYDGYHLHVSADTAKRGLDNKLEHYDADEVVPFSEAQPSPDGAYWRCRRHDGSRRCFFAPPPNT